MLAVFHWAVLVLVFLCLVGLVLAWRRGAAETKALKERNYHQAQSIGGYIALIQAAKHIGVEFSWEGPIAVAHLPQMYVCAYCSIGHQNQLAKEDIGAIKAGTVIHDGVGEGVAVCRAS